VSPFQQDTFNFFLYPTNKILVLYN
jgi:hypothetical protein